MGLDVGTTKVCAIIGEQDADGVLSILGVGTTPSEGLKKGIVIDIKQTVDSIQKAVQKAQRMAGREICQVIVGIAGGYIQCSCSRASVEIINPARGVSPDDVQRVVERSKVLGMPVDREILHAIPQEYYTDSGPVINPLGQITSKLEVTTHIITASVTSIQNLVRCVNTAGYNTTAILLEAIASAHAILLPQDRELGVLILDIGGGTTDVAVFSRGHIRYSGVIPHGGDNITNDIAYGLKISSFDAENVKKKHGCGMVSMVRPDETFSVKQVLTEKSVTFKRQFLANIIEARLEEIFHLVKESIQVSPVRDKNFAGVVVTGGTALIEGIAELAEKVFECPAHMGVPRGLKGMTGVTTSPIYATGIGLVKHGFLDALNQPLKGRGLFNKITRAMSQLLVNFK